MSAETLTVDSEEDGMRLDRWFRRRRPNLSITHLNKIVRTGQVRVDGGRVKVSTRLAEGQSVRVPPLNLNTIASVESGRPGNDVEDRRRIADMVLFEDRDILVLNKPYGLAVQGGSGTHEHIDGLLASLSDAKGNRPLLVHRLDRDTSGVLLVARNRKIAADLGHAFRSRQTRKIYWALVEGVPKPAQGRISLFLAKGDAMGDKRSESRSGADRASLERMRVAKHGEDDAQHSVTLYATLDKVAPRLAWLSMKPITGRTHQLRAHAEAIGHPDCGRPEIRRRPGECTTANRSSSGVARRRRAQAALGCTPADPAPSGRGRHRRDGTLAAPHAEQLEPVRLRRAEAGSDRGGAR